MALGFHRKQLSPPVESSPPVPPPPIDTPPEDPDEFEAARREYDKYQSDKLSDAGYVSPDLPAVLVEASLWAAEEASHQREVEASMERANSLPKIGLQAYRIPS